MKSIRLAITAICLTLFPHNIVAGPAWEPIVPFGVVKGVVRDTSGRPLPYANVTVVGHRLVAMSDRDGLFAIYFVPPGTQMLKGMMMGYETVWRDRVEVQMGRVTELTLEMKVKPSVSARSIE